MSSEKDNEREWIIKFIESKMDGEGNLVEGYTASELIDDLAENAHRELADATPEAEIDGPGEPEIIDRADGVRGHFAIGRKLNARAKISIWEFWSKNRWCSAGEVFYSRTAAERVLQKLRGLEARV